MSKKVLYEELENGIEFLKNRGYLDTELPKSITSNIKQPLRPYQIKALENFIFYCEDKEYKNIKSKHLLFHMATGSGKTNIIVSTILYLYSQGYRDFIFFVNTTNIISKTKANILNKHSSKYLFNQNMKIDINEITDTFDSSKNDSINILFTTTHKLHGNLETTIKENSITYADFENRKVVLIADEAHHLNSEFKKGKKTKDDEENIKSWGTTTKKILTQNKENILLEFTATAEINTNTEIKNHYSDKLITEYPLIKFREDKYSKDIKLINSGMDTNQRVLQSIMISEYRQIVAKENLQKYIKPIVMFKNPKGIEKIDKSFEDFKKLIDDLEIKDIDEIFLISNIKAINELEKLIDDKAKFVNRLKHSFSSDKCLVIYSTSKDKEEKLKLLNSLEDAKNNIRAIFAVNVLNEGWDVLNLYDIVKLDEAKSSGAGSTAEAQLIGRGARYYPFEYKENDKYKRKFDNDLDNPIRMLEEMYFHSINQNEYIKSLKNELSKIGLYDGNEDETVELKLKDSFIDDELYKKGVVYINEPLDRDKESEIFGINFYKKSYKNISKSIDNSSSEILILDEIIEDKNYDFNNSYKLNSDIDLVRSAINKKPFFYFASLKKYFPNLKSISEFIANENYLGDVKFSIKSTNELKLNNQQKLNFILVLFDDLEKNILKNSRDRIGSKIFKPVRISNRIQKIKTLKKKASDSRIRQNQSWYVFEEHGGTSEESGFVDFISNSINQLNQNYDDIKLIRNEKSFEIFAIADDKNADRFEPDFILMLKSKNDGCYHQIFCEPKGNWAKDDNDSFEKSPEKWKQDFLADITQLTTKNDLTLECMNENSLEMYENECYKLFGLPFYNDELKDDFKDSFDELVLK